MKERKGWREDFRTVYMELVKTVDTDRITRKIRDEVVPEMLKLKPEIDKKINLNIENLDPAEMEENPQWQEMMESSGLADKLKEMSEIQEEGGDVMLGTFERLKTFPFFRKNSFHHRLLLTAQYHRGSCRSIRIIRNSAAGLLVICSLWPN
jgi:hypothetical protein